MKPYIAAFLMVLSFPVAVSAQATVYAEGLVNPTGVFVDDDGLLWVTSQGTGADDAGVYVVTPDGAVHPFIEGLPSVINLGEPAGTNNAFINNDVDLLIVQGEGNDAESASILAVDTTGWSPGDAPLGAGDIDGMFKVGDFVDAELGEGSNPYDIAFVPSSDLVFLTDAKANALVRGEDGVLSIHAQFPDVPNTGSQGPLTVDAVPTGLDYRDGKLYVGTLTGFPFNTGAASIFEIDTLGSVVKLRGGLTTVVDLQMIPGEEGLVFLEHRFAPNAGILYKLQNDELTELATGLDRPAGLRFGNHGEVYVSLLARGEIVVVEGVSTSSEREVPTERQRTLVQSYPNPFTDTVTLSVTSVEPGPARFVVVDALGRTVHSEEFGLLGSGTHRLGWDGKDARGADVASGVYLFNLEAGGSTSSGVLIRN